MLEIEALDAFYNGNPALTDISLQISRGEIVALVGTNGAGKTTLLNCISGLHSEKTGSLSFDDIDITHCQAYKRVRLGIVHCPENRQLFGSMTVEENIEMGAFVCSGRAKEDTVASRMKEVLNTFPSLKSRMGHLAFSLSGGEQQMVAIARSLMSNPKLLLLDEPSLGLAPMLVEEIFDIIRRLRDSGRTILLVEQNAVGALSLSDRAYLLETGRITLTGHSSVFMLDERVRRSYLGNDVD